MISVPRAQNPRVLPSVSRGVTGKRLKTVRLRTLLGRAISSEHERSLSPRVVPELL
jgi:hypothetical protein